MSENERPLPKPPGSPFGGKRRFEGTEDKEALIADRMVMAAAEGRLEEFMQKEMPDSEYSRSLARMMMGMTGMMPQSALPAGGVSAAGASAAAPAAPTGEEGMVSGPPSEDIVRAAQAGDTNALMGLLKKEHARRMGDGGEYPVEERPAEEKDDKGELPKVEGLSGEEKNMLDALVRIASDNRVELDWLISRALKLYVQDYLKTGKL